MSVEIPGTWRKPRPIQKRIFVYGTLELVTPAHFGAGDPDPLSHVKMALLKDPLTGNALLPGTSIAGALRNYLREFQLGYDELFEELAPNERLEKERKSWACKLFGGYKGDDDGVQSLLIVNDALAQIDTVEIRAGVRIDPATRTAKENMLFSMEALPVGTSFDLSFELLLPDAKSNALTQMLALALHGLETGEITLGARKHRGFGQSKVTGWQVTEHNLTEPQGLINWLTRKTATTDKKPIKAALGVKLSDDEYKDARKGFDMEASFVVDGSLLIRSGFGSIEGSPDTAHLHIRHKNGQVAPIIPGTSWAGVIRHRALRIAKTVASASHQTQAQSLVNQMFGAGNEDDPQAVLTTSRVKIKDSKIVGGKSKVQTRVKIDRFTGGAYETGLINEEPLWSNKTATVDLQLHLRNPADYEIGLLLLVLKDLWTGDVALGGESSVGRGRLAGQTACLDSRLPKIKCKIEKKDAGISVTEPESEKSLQDYVAALQDWLKKEAKQ